MPNINIPNWLYEGLRWAISIALPALIVCVNTIGTTWGWLDEITAGRLVSTGAAITLCAGILFGWAKLSNDANQNGIDDSLEADVEPGA